MYRWIGALVLGACLLMPKADAAAAERKEQELPGYVAVPQGQQMPAEKRDRRDQGTAESVSRNGRQESGHAKEVERNAKKAANEIKKVRLTWPIVPGAVRYQVVLLRDGNDTPANIVHAQEFIFTTGVEIDLRRYGERAKDFYWKVCPLSFEGTAIGHFSKPQSILEQEIDPKKPLPTTEYEKMDYFPLYPAFSWVPAQGAKLHEVQVIRHRAEGDVVVRKLYGGEYDVYDEAGYTVPGDYAWRVRSLRQDGRAASEWSEPSGFRVTAPVKVAALGDSITHGGGAMVVPLSQTMYNWETYSPVAVKNLGYSGNTTGDMLERFEKDVLPFQPKILVIMGGVNDCRGYVPGWDTVMNLALIQKKCIAYGIIPVFASVTPINPEIIALRGVLEMPREDWQVHQEYVNEWIMRQEHHVDVHTVLSDSLGRLEAAYTSDGLHPDMEAKKYIGETIGAYLLSAFPDIVQKR